MGGMSSQVFWKEPWNPEAETTLQQALSTQRCTIHELNSQQWDPKTASIGGVRDIMTSYLAPAAASWSSVLLHLNAPIGEDLAAELSRLTGGPSIVLMEYDQDAWGYSLFDGGTVLDRFWSVPEAVDLSPEECTGSFETVSSVFGVPSESLAPYICHVTEIARELKAFEDDEYTLGDHWVRIDFMRRLGLDYPAPGQVAGGRYVKIDEPGK